MTEIEELRHRDAPLEIEPAEFRRIGHRLIDDVADRLAQVASGPVTRDESAVDLRRLIAADRPLPLDGADAADLLRETTALLFDHSLFNSHPRFFGYITSSPAPIGMFGEFLAAAINQNVGAWALSPLATEIESQAVRWVAQVAGFPAGGGLLVSGGNMANIVCFIAARAAKAGWNVRQAGLPHDRRRLLVYASAATHTWIQKAADLSGLGTDAIRWIPTDAAQRIDVAALRRQIADDRRDAGQQPFLVVGNAGTVATGTVDPLAELAGVCREHDLWFHVDGAYGAMAARVPGAPESLAGLALADSLTVDPHKWLYAPIEAGCALVRDAEHLRDTFSYHPPYYQFGEDVVNYHDYGPQNTRGFRALKVWLALRQVGAAGCQTMIADDIKLSRYLYDLLSGHPAFEVVTQNLSIATFRYVPPDLRPQIGSEAGEIYLNELNRRLLKHVERSGEAFLSNAVLDGRFLLRACIVNFHTSVEDVEALPVILSRLGRESDIALRHELAMAVAP